MAIKNNNERLAAFCDWGMVASISACIFVLPAAIAYLDSFAGLAVSFYILKRASRVCIDWPLRTPSLSAGGKISFFLRGFAPAVNVINRPLQFLALAFFISVLFSRYPSLSFLAFFGKFVKCVFLYFSFVEAFNNEKRMWIFVTVFLASALITASSGIFQHYTGKDFLKGHYLGYENYALMNRINSSFLTANGFGAYLLPVLGLSAQLLFTALARKAWVWGGILVFFSGLMLVCLCWTYSRSAWVGYVVMVIAMVLMDWRKLLLAGALLLVFVLLFLPSLNNVRHLYLINDMDTTQTAGQGLGPNIKVVLGQGGSGRWEYWKKAFSIIRSSPVCGTGLNTYGRIIMQDPDRTKWWYAHNCYLQMTAETGVLGLACFLWMLYALLRYGWISCKYIEQAWPLAFLQGTLSGLFGFLVQSFFDNTFYTVQLGMMMWMLFGFTVAAARLAPAENKR